MAHHLAVIHPGHRLTLYFISICIPIISSIGSIEASLRANFGQPSSEGNGRLNVWQSTQRFNGNRLNPHYRMRLSDGATPSPSG